MERLASEACALPDVACVTYAEAMEELQSRPSDSSGL